MTLKKYRVHLGTRQCSVQPRSWFLRTLLPSCIFLSVVSRMIPWHTVFSLQSVYLSVIKAIVSDTAKTEIYSEKEICRLCGWTMTWIGRWRTDQDKLNSLSDCLTVCMSFVSSTIYFSEPIENCVASLKVHSYFRFVTGWTIAWTIQ